MVVVKYQGSFYSLSNRRLFVFRVPVMLNKLKTVQIKLVPMDADIIQKQKYSQKLGREASWWDRAFTTRNEGRTVRVRGQGSRFSELQWPSDAPSSSFCELQWRSDAPRSGRSRSRIAKAKHKRSASSPEPF